MGSSSQTVTTGYNYNGSFAQIVCMGPIDILHAIQNGDLVIWQGPIRRVEAMDADGKTTLATSIGRIDFYWGTVTQAQSPILAGLFLDQGAGPITVPMPAYLGVCYAVSVDVSFGTQVTPPTLQYVVSKFTNNLTLLGKVTSLNLTGGGAGYLVAPDVSFVGGGGSGATAIAGIEGGVVTTLTLTNQGSGFTVAPVVAFTPVGADPGDGASAGAYIFHELEGDCLLPEAIYDFLTNELYGLAVDPAEIDEQSFIDASDTISDEDLGVSPNFDSLGTMREVLGKMTAYIDAVLRYEHGKIKIVLIRPENMAAADTLTAEDFTDEPKPRNRGFTATNNMIRLSFTDRLNKWEDGVEPYDNPANAEIQGTSVDKQVNYPFITRREVAKVVAKRVGLKLSKPPFFFDVRLKPSHSTRQPGEVIKVTWPKLGLSETPCRIMEISRGGPNDPDVEATLMHEQTRDTSHDYVPPFDNFVTPGTIDSSGGGAFEITPLSVRVGILPSALKDGAADGFLVVFDRPDPVLRLAKVFWTWDPVEKTYAQIAQNSAFPLHGTIIGWWKIAPASWVFRVRLPVDHDVTEFAAIAPTVPAFYFVTGQREVKLYAPTSNEHTIDPIWGRKVESGYFQAIDDDLYDIEVTAAEFATDDFVIETVAGTGTVPTENVYFGQIEKFVIYPTDAIYFERSGPNAPVNPSTGLSPDTDQKRYFKVTAANQVSEQALADAEEVTFDRNDASMTLLGTYTPNWGPRAPTMYEAVDILFGEVFSLETSAGYPDVNDIDEALGAMYDGTETDEQEMIAKPIDDVLGTMLTLGSVVYSDNPL